MMKGINFDVDGTLLDSMHIWGELGERYLFPMSLDERNEYLKEAYSFSDSVEKITEDTIKILVDFYRNEAVPKKGEPNFIKKMHNKKIMKRSKWI